MIANELMGRHNLKQAEVAKILGLSQPAVSLYHRKMRGKAITLENDAEVMKLVEDFAASLAQNNLSHRDFILTFCRICQVIRAKGLLCEMHKIFDPLVDIDKCRICLPLTQLTCV
jgi:predicted transcriptional regulator